MNRFTPGPWHYVTHSWSNASVITKNECICALDISYADEKNQLSLEAVMAANARLIAAAPQLFEACKAFIEYDKNDATDGVAMMFAYSDMLKACRAAIAKAEGGQKVNGNV